MRHNIMFVDNSISVLELGFGKIGLTPMRPEEIEDIFNLASFYSNNMLKFQKKFIDEVKNLSAGYPYYAQLFGQIALDAHAEHYSLDVPATITKQILYRGFENFAKYEPEMDNAYERMIGNDPDRELMLRAMANQVGDRILQGNIFDYCIKRGAPLPKKNLATILSIGQPSLIKRIDKNYICFPNPLFKIFCRIKKPIFV